MFVVHLNLAIFRRRLFNFLTLLSLLLCLATVALWMRSYSRRQALLLFATSPGWIERLAIESLVGELSLSYDQFLGGTEDSGWIYEVSSPYSVTTHGELLREYPRPRSATFLGFGYDFYYSRSTDHPARAIWFPHWFLALILAVLPALRLRNLLRTRRRNRIGLCPHCGYDLRASPSRCPECGADKLLATDEHR
jgi:hypothetical protein